MLNPAEINPKAMLQRLAMHQSRIAPKSRIQILDRSTSCRDYGSTFECRAIIYQDRNLDLPWDANSAEQIAKAAWPEANWAQSVAVLGIEQGDFPVKFIQRWDS